MARFKPQASYITQESEHKYWHGNGKSEYITKQFNSYAELKKDLKRMCDENICEDGVWVLRSRRGEFGEYYEYWQIDVYGKLHIIKKGWN